jgi:hypothetical protein
MRLLSPDDLAVPGDGLDRASGVGADSEGQYPDTVNIMGREAHHTIPNPDRCSESGRAVQCQTARLCVWTAARNTKTTGRTFSEMIV